MIPLSLDISENGVSKLTCKPYLTDIALIRQFIKIIKKKYIRNNSTVIHNKILIGVNPLRLLQYIVSLLVSSLRSYKES